MLVGVIVLVALLLLALSVAAPVVAKELRRQKELESQQRAEQYVRAIRLFYRKTHSYPASLDALKQTSNVRFLRQEYVDPLTGKADWRLIHQGEQKTTVKGFFGQELGGLASGGGLGSASGLASGVGTPIGSAGSSSTSTISGASALAGGFEGASTTTSTPGVGGLTGSSGATGSTGSSNAAGGVIVGVGTAATGNSITTPNKQTTYESWEFWYDPRIEQLYQKGKSNGGVGSTGLSGATGLGSASGLSSGFGSSITGSSGSTGSTGPTGSTGATSPNQP